MSLSLARPSHQSLSWPHFETTAMEDTSSSPRGPPPSRQTILPSPPARGGDVRAPGPWAIHIHKLPFRSARQGDILQGRYLDALNAMPNQREPCLGWRSNWTAVEFQRQMNRTRAHVEAALMQVVGHQNEVPCATCQHGLGVFAHCVSVDGISSLTACASCHWKYIDRACQCSRIATTTDTPMTVRDPGNNGQDHTSTISARAPPSNPFGYRSTTRPGVGATTRAVAYSPERLELFINLLKHMVNERKLRNQSQRVKDQLQGLQNELIAANITTTATGHPLQQIVDDIRASHEELHQGIESSLLSIREVIDSIRSTPSLFF